MRITSRCAGITGSLLTVVVLLLVTACHSRSAVQPSDVSGTDSSATAWSPSYPSTGPEVVAYIAQRYPERLAANVSLADRIANMEFLRDKIIEIGICGGMDIGWNMKRGGPEKSKDFVAWFDGRHYMGVDIASAYDAPQRTLQLKWDVYGRTPDYREYQPRPRCK